jgi:hypothetical protein
MQGTQEGERDEPYSLRLGWLRPERAWNPLSNPLVGPCTVEVFDILFDHPMKLSVPDNQQVIKAFSPQAPQQPFADGVGLWSTVGRL